MLGKQKWSASLRGRAGYLVTPEALLYGTLGAAWSKINSSVISPGVVEDSSASIHGVQVGAGVETVVAANWRARLEYLHTFYSTASLDPTTTGLTWVRPSVGLGRIAAIYQFGQGQGASASWPAAAPVAPSWSGFYAGSSLGGGIGYADVSVPGLADIKGVGLAGPVPSVFAGYNYRFAPRWVVGAEAEVAPSVRSTDLKLGWLASVRGRLGYLLRPDTLVYGSAGWVGTALDDIAVNGVVAIQAQRIDGLQLGGGVEAAFNDAWSARLDYQYSIMQSMTVTLPGATALTATARPRGHVGRVALVRHFGG